MTGLSVRESHSTVTEPIARANVSAVQCFTAAIERRSGGATRCQWRHIIIIISALLTQCTTYLQVCETDEVHLPILAR